MKARRDIFQAISDPIRRSILRQLLNGPETVGGIAEQFEVTRQAISLHTRVLEECAAITIEKHGRERLCRLKPATLAQVSDWLEPFVDLWSQRFDQLEDLLANPEETENEAVTE